jgi:hypothetical protein
MSLEREGSQGRSSKGRDCEIVAIGEEDRLIGSQAISGSTLTIALRKAGKTRGGIDELETVAADAHPTSDVDKVASVVIIIPSGNTIEWESISDTNEEASGSGGGNDVLEATSVTDI